MRAPALLFSASRFFASLFLLKLHANIDFFALFYFLYFFLDKKVPKNQGFTEIG